MQNDMTIRSDRFSAPVVEGDGLFSLIPQRPPIVMVDAFYGVEGVSSYSGLTVRRDNIFFDGGRLCEPGLVEHVAQSAAAREGYVCQCENRPVPLGFIGQLKNFKIYGLPSEGDKLCTTITMVSEFMGVSLISATVRTGETLWAECEMKIFLKEE